MSCMSSRLGILRFAQNDGIILRMTNEKNDKLIIRMTGDCLGYKVGFLAIISLKTYLLYKIIR